MLQHFNNDSDLINDEKKHNELHLRTKEDFQAFLSLICYFNNLPSYITFNGGKILDWNEIKNKIISLIDSKQDQATISFHIPLQIELPYDILWFSSWEDLASMCIRSITYTLPHVRWLLPILSLIFGNHLKHSSDFKLPFQSHSTYPLTSQFLTSFFPFVWFYLGFHIFLHKEKTSPNPFTTIHSFNTQHEFHIHILQIIEESLLNSKEGIVLENEHVLTTQLEKIGSLICKLPHSSKKAPTFSSKQEILPYTKYLFVLDSISNEVKFILTILINQQVIFSNKYVSLHLVGDKNAPGHFWIQKLLNTLESTTENPYIQFKIIKIELGSISTILQKAKTDEEDENNEKGKQDGDEEIGDSVFSSNFLSPPQYTHLHRHIFVLCCLEALIQKNGTLWNNTLSQCIFKHGEIACYHKMISRITNILTMGFTHGKRSSFMSKYKHLKQQLPTATDYYQHYVNGYFSTMGIDTMAESIQTYRRNAANFEINLSPSFLTSQGGPKTNDELSAFKYLTKSASLKPYEVTKKKDKFYNDNYFSSSHTSTPSEIIDSIEEELFEYFANESVYPPSGHSSDLHKINTYPIQCSFFNIAEFLCHVSDTYYLQPHSQSHHVLGNVHTQHLLTEMIMSNPRSLNLQSLFLGIDKSSFVHYLEDILDQMGLEKKVLQAKKEVYGNNLSHLIHPSPFLKHMTTRKSHNQTSKWVFFITQNITYIYNTIDRFWWIDRGYNNDFSHMQIDPFTSRLHYQEIVKHSSCEELELELDTGGLPFFLDKHMLKQKTKHLKSHHILDCNYLGTTTITSSFRMDMGTNAFISLLIAYNGLFNSDLSFSSSSGRVKMENHDNEEYKIELLIWKLNVIVLYKTSPLIWGNHQLLGNFAVLWSSFSPFNNSFSLYKAPNIPINPIDILKCFGESSSNMEEKIFCLCFLIVPLNELLLKTQQSSTNSSFDHNDDLYYSHAVILGVENNVEITNVDPEITDRFKRTHKYIIRVK
jgi:hypothetical protein